MRTCHCSVSCSNGSLQLRAYNYITLTREAPAVDIIYNIIMDYDCTYISSTS